VAAQGVSYFTAAGNAGDDADESAFQGSNKQLTLQTSTGVFELGEMHDFDRGAGVDVRQRIVVPEGQDMFVTFQWDQPFASLSTGGRASQSDMDILLFKSGAPLTLDNLVAISASANVGRGPVEMFRFVHQTNAPNFDLVITHFGGPEAGRMKYVELGGARIAEHQTDSGTVFGHAPAEGAVGVGAAFWGFTPNHGQAAPILEDFSFCRAGDDSVGRRRAVASPMPMCGSAPKWSPLTASTPASSAGTSPSTPMRRQTSSAPPPRRPTRRPWPRCCWTPTLTCRRTTFARRCATAPSTWAAPASTTTAAPA